MLWGFPLAMKGKSGQPLKPKPVNNTRADKLDSFMWRYSFQERRCLTPVTEFAEAEGGFQDLHLVLTTRRAGVFRRKATPVRSAIQGRNEGQCGAFQCRLAFDVAAPAATRLRLVGGPDRSLPARWGVILEGTQSRALDEHTGCAGP